ncbi:M16 family metallopeptidase [Luteirhabdus pelagi]|uniref:M16 family metallopeptidase n=1 Tax=Luteirhabdus pelagi TaxID=2792783 RepID=UPI00193942AF|nr:pitrilysin family protein [Luteirhabdus pelagi]
MKNIYSLLLACLFVATSAVAQIDRSKQPQPGRTPKINLTKPQTFSLPNGMQVMVVENNKLPRVRVQLLLDNPMHASGSKAGVENLVSQMMGNGTTNIPKDEFNEEIDYLGANISFGSESAFASTLSKYFPRILEMMADAVKNPLFTGEEFDKAKERLIENLRSQEKSVSNVASRVNSALLYGSQHPKGEFTSIDKAEQLTLADVRSFYGDYFSPANAYLVVVGDVKMNNVERLVREHFSDWQKTTVPNISYTEPQDVPYTQINFIDMPNAVQSELSLENVVNLEMSHPDYHAVLIANKILGGGFNGMLNMNLREENGWTYGAYSSIGADKDVTRFRAFASVRNAVTDSAIVESLKEINEIRTKEVSQQDLVNAKAKYTGDFILALERPETIANYALQIETQDLPNNFWTNYLKNINAVTAADVKRVANKYFKEGNLRIVVVGKGSEVLKSLQNITNPLTGKTIPIQYFDPYANPVDAPDYDKKVEAGVTAETIFNDYLKAIGGKENVKNVNSMMMKANASMQGMNLGMEIKNTTAGKSSMVISMGGTPMQKVVFDGEKGYTMAQGQKMEFTEEQIEKAKKNAVPFDELTVGDAKVVGIEPMDGKDMYVVQMSESSKAYYSKESGLKLKEVEVQKQGEQEMSQTTLYNDYKEVKGIKVPHTITVSFGPQQLDFNVTEVKINEGVSDADFE